MFFENIVKIWLFLLYCSYSWQSRLKFARDNESVYRHMSIKFMASEHVNSLTQNQGLFIMTDPKTSPEDTSGTLPYFDYPVFIRRAISLH